ncbi:hypothetical protein TNCV_191791 [Trichonephila clavipes]|nr:hypothetical protein TNCV_191791 [Trichonephila clavipes]
MFSVIPTIQSESQSPILISTTTTTIPDNSLNTSASSLSTETHLFPISSNKFAAISTEIQPLVPLQECAVATLNSEPSNASKIPKSIKQNSKNRRKHTKIQKPEIARNKNGTSQAKKTSFHYDSEDEDMYDVDEKLMDIHIRSGFSHFMTPTRNRRN